MIKLALFLTIISIANFNCAQTQSTLDPDYGKFLSSLRLLKSIDLSTNSTSITISRTNKQNETEKVRQFWNQKKVDVQLKLDKIQKIHKLRSKRSASTTSQSKLENCLDQLTPIEILSDTISNEIRKCAVVGMSENQNLLTDTILMAQSIMVLPHKIGEILKNCGESQECMDEIARVSIVESAKTASKVYMLSTKIQQLADRSFYKMTGCAMDGLVQILAQGIALIQDLIYCDNGKE